MSQQNIRVINMAEEVLKIYSNGEVETALSKNEELRVYVKENVQDPAIALETVGDSYSKKQSWELAKISYAYSIQTTMDHSRKNDEGPHASFSVLQKYANVCMNLKDLTGAMRAFQKCLAITRSRSLMEAGSDPTSAIALDPRIPDILSNIARIQFEQGSICGAIKVYKYCLTMQRTLSDRDVIAEANTMTALGRIFRVVGRTEAAIEWHEEALELRAKLLGETHMSLAPDLLAIAKIHYRLEELDLSLATFSDCLHILRSNPDSNTGLISSILYNMGIICSRLDDRSNAEGCFEEAIIAARLIVDSDPASRPIFAKSQYCLATIRQTQGRTSSAVKCVEEAIEYGLLEENTDAFGTLTFLLQLYASFGDTIKVKYYSERIAELDQKEGNGGRRKKPRMHGALAA